MELFSNKLAGLVLIAGSILFLIAAFLPYNRVFIEPDPSARLEILHQKRIQWNLGQVLFAAGAVIAALGLVFLFVKYRGSIQGSWPWVGLVIIFKDMPPFVYYLFTFVLAIKLLVKAG